MYIRKQILLALKHILEKIASWQVGDDSRFFAEGVFPSQRENVFLGYRRPDDNIFATASTVFILNELVDFFPEDEKAIVDKITQNARKAYPLYLNKDGLATYNFWKTRPSDHFPNGYLFYRFRHFKLPDDIDDTALIYLTTQRTTDEIAWLKEKLKRHANPQTKVYSTWFGEKMPIEHDVCALCNLMCLLLKSRLPLNQYDVATINYLFACVESNDFVKKPFQTARHYGTFPLIAYHYARFCSYFTEYMNISENIEIINEMIKIKNIVIINIIKYLKNINLSKNNINYLLLTISLLKMGEKAIDLQGRGVEKRAEFYSFIGAPFAPYNVRFASWKPSQIGWKCMAHEKALKLEYEILQKIGK